jgi:hypothetical protein
MDETAPVLQLFSRLLSHLFNFGAVCGTEAVLFAALPGKVAAARAGTVFAE